MTVVASPPTSSDASQLPPSPGPGPSPSTSQRPNRRRSLWRRPTPWLLKAFTAAAIAASILFALIAALSASNVRSGFDAIGSTEEPQVSAGNDLIYALNDMDANLADILMVGDKSLGPGVDRAAFTKLFEADRAEADHDLQLAALHAGAEGTGAQQVGAALNALGGYEALAGQVMYVDTTATSRTPGSPPADRVGPVRPGHRPDAHLGPARLRTPSPTPTAPPWSPRIRAGTAWRSRPSGGSCSPA